MDITKLRTWFIGLVGACINSAAGAGALVLVDATDFNPFHGGLVKLGTVTFTLALVGFYLYIQNHPIPFGDDPSIATKEH